MTVKTIKNLNLLVMTSALLAFGSSAFAKDSTFNTVSSLCHPEDTQNFECENSSDCAFKTRTAIKDFYGKYEAPKPKKVTKLNFPNKCSSYHSAKHDAVNLSYNVLPDGKSEGVKVINSSNQCFHQAAISHIEKIKYNTSDNGYACIPASILFVSNRGKTGKTFDSRDLGLNNIGIQSSNLPAAYGEIRLANVRRGG